MTTTEDRDAVTRATLLYRDGRWREGEVALRELIETASDERTRARARLALVDGWNLETWKRGLNPDHDKHGTLDEVERAAAQLDDDALEAGAAYQRGMALHQEFIMAEGNLDRELESFARAAERYEQIGDREGAAMATAMVGIFHHVDRLDRTTAEPILRRAYEMAPDDGTSYARSEAARHLGQIRQELGDPEAGLRYLEESLRIREQAGWPLHLPSAHHVIGYAKLEAGDFESARLHLDKAIELAEQLDAALTVAMAKRNRADLDFALLAPAVWRRSHP